MTEADSIVISFGLLVVTGIALFTALSQEWRAARALVILFCIAYGMMLGQALGAVLEVMP